MRYIELHDGSVVLSTGNATSHRDLLRLVGRREASAVSAGFLGARYSPEDAWTPFGTSVGLDLKANEKLAIPEQLYVGRQRYGFVYANKPALLEGLEDVQPAVWGMSDESSYGDVCPVFVPMHPCRKLRADEALAR